MTAPAGGEPAIRIRGVAKAFGPVQANRDASLEVARGEIHALVGENGAGKSTLMRMLAGMFAPDAGTIEVAPGGGAGSAALRDVTGWSTNEAIAAGVGMVHQHFMLVPTLTVAENVMLGRELTRGMALDRARAETEVRALSERTGLLVPPDRRVSELSVGEAQRVEILKVLYRGAKILVLDEPTAVLSPPEVDELWAVLRELARAGGTVVLITHKLDEVVAISDAITVMRAGATVARIRTAETTPRDIARAMVGRDVALALDHASLAGPSQVAHAAPAPAPRADARAAALAVRDLVVPGARRPNEVDGIGFDVRAGEIFGIAGVEGNGQTELIEAIAGLRAATAGSIALGARDITRLSVRERADAGLSHIPEDRHRRGLVLDYSVADNLILGLQHRFAAGAGVDRARVAANARQQIERFDIRPGDASLAARALSGGNQQKIVVAREMTGRDYVLLLAAQPTRGVDVGAIEFIHDQLRAARDAGKGVLLVSADLAEVLALSDRIGVMYRGRLATVMDRADASAEALGPYMTGAAA
jgi:general nucleoside transport system ATP-binding protein